MMQRRMQGIVRPQQEPALEQSVPCGGAMGEPLSAPYRLRQLLLLVLYEHGMHIARRYRRRLLLIEKRKKRWQTAEQIPT